LKYSLVGAVLDQGSYCSKIHAYVSPRLPLLDWAHMRGLTAVHLGCLYCRN